jgi:hypothetical protein
VEERVHGDTTAEEGQKEECAGMQVLLLHSMVCMVVSISGSGQYLNACSIFHLPSPLQLYYPGEPACADLFLLALEQS